MFKLSNMKYINWSQVQELAVKQQGQWGVYVNNSLDFDNEKDAEIWNSLTKTFEALHGGFHGEYHNYSGWMVAGSIAFFETKEDAEYIFSLLNNEMTDHSAFYVALYSPDLGCVDENC